MMLGQNFPIKEELRANILDAETITRGGGWWVAALLIEDLDNKRYVELFKWQNTPNGWKIRKSYKITRKRDSQQIIDILTRMQKSLE